MDQNNSSPLSFQDLMEASALRLSEGGYLTSFDILFSLIASFFLELLRMLFKVLMQLVIVLVSMSIAKNLLISTIQEIQ